MIPVYKHPQTQIRANPPEMFQAGVIPSSQKKKKILVYRSADKTEVHEFAYNA